MDGLLCQAARHPWLTTKQPKDAPLIEDVRPPQEEAVSSAGAQPLICHVIMIFMDFSMATSPITNIVSIMAIRTINEGHHCRHEDSHCHGHFPRCEAQGPAAVAVPGPDNNALLPFELHLLRYWRLGLTIGSSGAHDLVQVLPCMAAALWATATARAAEMPTSF